MTHARIALAALLIAVFAPALMNRADAATPRPHTACAYEDSNWCVWDAKHMGNGEGHSFWVGHKGQVHYISHRRAHRMARL